MTYATTVQQLGQAYCDVVSNSTLRDEDMDTAIIKDLIAIRLKLTRAKGLMTNVPYELSIRGKWPKERYITVHEIQMYVSHASIQKKQTFLSACYQGIGILAFSSSFSDTASWANMVKGFSQAHAVS